MRFMMMKGRKSKVITLTTDFGLNDPYVAAMKGVILSINPNVMMIDISHSVPKHDPLTAGFLLLSIAKYFPAGSIHLCVVDPGVGTERRGLILWCKDYILVGPDNGCLSLASDASELRRAFAINIEKLHRSVSATFHGRDLFAPAAAYLSLGVPPSAIAEPIRSFKRISIPPPRLSKGRLKGTVLYIDNFGNIVTNITPVHLQDIGVRIGDELKISLKSGEYRAPFLYTYGNVKKGELLALINSFNLLEVSIREDNAAEKLKTRRGDFIAVEKF